VTLRMKVKAAGVSSKGFADLVSEANHKVPEAFIVRISPEAKEKFKEQKIADAGKHFNQQFIRVTGTVKIVRYDVGNRPVIEVNGPSQIEIIDPEPFHSPGDALLKLYQSGKLFDRSAYKEVRTAFARRFETAHDADLRSAYGADFDALNEWFA